MQDSGVLHRVAIDSHQKRSCLVVNQELVKIEGRFQVVLCGAWKARRYASIELRQHQRPIRGQSTSCRLSGTLTTGIGG